MIRTALVTGASSGIGLEICRLLARDGARVVMVARDGEKLQRAARWVQTEFPHAALKIFDMDLSRPGAAQALAAHVAREVDPIDFLANNAGVGSSGRFAEADLLRETALIQLNVTTLVEMTHLVLRDMLSRRSGRILNVASTAGFLPGPLMAVYYASKAFVVSFSCALAEEVRGSGVSVTALCPGPTPTGFQGRAGIERSRLLRGPLVLEAGPVAAAGYRAALAGKPLIIPGMANQTMVQALRLLPRAAVVAMARRANETAPHPDQGGREGNGGGGAP